MQMSGSNNLDRAERILGALIETDPGFLAQRLAHESVVAYANEAFELAKIDGSPEEKHRALHHLMAWAEIRFTTVQDEAGVLEGEDPDHQPWVRGNESQLFPEGGFWQNYRRLVEPKLPPNALRELDRSTGRIVDLLGDPNRDGPWDRRGLVIGHVQSGKTNNYLGVVTKAADAGYRLIIILAGSHNNLRAQTQHRFDEAFVGVDTRKARDGTRAAFGVGLYNSHNPVFSMTQATEHGDFKQAVADGIGNPFAHSNLPTVFVVKKHVTVLETLHDWLRRNSGIGPGDQTIPGVPLLLVDDEADNASIDTSDHADKETTPTGTNRRIRQILRLFEQSAYVGYTATPYANVFIDVNAEDEKAGDDLFPRDFIVGLQAPSNYVGAEKVFGRDADNPGLPMVNMLVDHEEWMPASHSSDFVPQASALPESLRRALDSFILACAARRLRGDQTRPNSMLVHVTRFKIPQAEVGQQLTDLLAERFNELSYSTNDDPVWNRLDEIWSKDFVPMAEKLAEEPGSSGRIDRFQDIREHIPSAVREIDVRLINGDSSDVLDYDEHPNGLSTIVVGGAKLSRGLTLEGLTVSYYARTTRQYDALMQMGRWFGYRPGYLDLCRIYAPPSVVDSFRSISLASEELLREVKLLDATGKTPKEFGLRVRHSPGMQITGNTKMRHTKLRRVGFGAARPESTSLELAFDRRRRALDHLKTLVANLQASTGEHEKRDSTDHAWRNVPSEVIAAYFEDLADDDLYPLTTARPEALATYIRKLNENDCLLDWTVLLKSKSDPPRKETLSEGIAVGLSRRTDSKRPGRYAFNSLIGSVDEEFDLTKDELAEARSLAGPDKTPTGIHFRHVRSPMRGLLIIYVLDPSAVDGDNGPPFAAYCVSFPADPDGTTVDYRINRVEQELTG